MAKKDFYPKTLADLLIWLELQLVQWPLHYAAFGLTTAQRDARLAEIEAALTAIKQVMKLQSDVARAEDQRDALLETFNAAYRADIQQYKNTVSLDPSLFEAFDWVGAGHDRPDPDTVRPRITGTHQSPTMNTIDFVRGQFDGVDAELSTDGSTWTKGGFDTRSPYEDTQPNRQPGTPEWRYYRFIYRLHDQPFGQYSEVVSLLTDIK